MFMSTLQFDHFHSRIQKAAIGQRPLLLVLSIVMYIEPDDKHCTSDVLLF